METQTHGKSRISEIAESHAAKTFTRQDTERNAAEKENECHRENIVKMFERSFSSILPMLKEAGVEYRVKIMYPGIPVVNESRIVFSYKGRIIWSMTYYYRGQYSGQYKYYDQQRPGRHSMDEFCFFLDVMMLPENCKPEKEQRIMDYLDTKCGVLFPNDNEICFKTGSCG